MIEVKPVKKEKTDLDKASGDLSKKVNGLYTRKSDITGYLPTLNASDRTWPKELAESLKGQVIEVDDCCTAAAELTGKFKAKEPGLSVSVFIELCTKITKMLERHAYDFGEAKRWCKPPPDPKAKGKPRKPKATA